ncbi:U4/U6.U5 small nuclear ribonucleoprotein 27 kDa protein [Aspergillus udagawae]|nr:U4/U6.U5 small nuclear ribonucleoprotein 27 kDa protein [Aspergillus udagawae]
MAEPPTKRARRVDSSTMWDLDERKTRSPEPDSDIGRSPRRDAYQKNDRRREGLRDDRRYRSRSRDRVERRRERSRSRDRRDRDRDRDRDRTDRDRDGRGARDGDISATRERHYDRRGYRDKYRDRSRSPTRNGNRDRTRTPPPRGPKGDRRDDRKDNRPHGNSVPHSPSRRDKDEMELDPAVPIEEDEMEALMRKSLGFTRFRSTKNTKVPGNNIYGVRKEKKTVYRQYMNRVGGFNRPLSP